MLLKKPKTIIWISLILGFLFDFLFFKKIPGISFFIFVFLIIISGLFLAKIENKKVSRNTIYLLIPILFFSTMSFIRSEPLTTFLNYLMTLILLGIFSHSFLGGKWPSYGIFNYLSAAFSLGIDALSRQILIFKSIRKPKDQDNIISGKRQKTWAYIRGIALTIPILLFFASLLSSADPVFAESFNNFLKFFNIEFFEEYIFRFFLIIFIAYLLSGIYLHSLYKDHDAQQVNIKIPKLLGFTETSIILGSVNLLFLSFVIIQFQYFFGGKENISLNGFTYAEYAQRGFAELVMVAVFSLILFLGLSSISKKERENQKKIFSGLGISLFLLIGVILVSALQRMLLYEQAYGFTRLRTYTHVFIIFLGILLAVVVLFELFNYQKFFTFAMLITLMGFVLTLNVLNVDAFIAKKNITRLEQFNKLDIGYLASLSEDMLPTLSELYNTSPSNKEEIAGILSCHALRNFNYKYEEKFNNPYLWQSFNYSRHFALKNWTQLMEGQSADYFTDNMVVSENEYFQFVMVNGEEISCW